MSLRGIGARRDTKCQYFNSLIPRKRKFLVNLSDLTSKFIFSELKAFFANRFSKHSSVSIRSIYLHHFGDLTLPPFGKVYTEHYISKFTCDYILCILCPKSYPLDFVIILPFMPERAN